MKINLQCDAASRFFFENKFFSRQRGEQTREGENGGDAVEWEA